MLKKIIFLMPYFGKWPEWFPFYLESCRWNPTIDWLFLTDCPIPDQPPTNTRFVQLSFSAYQQLVSDRLGITFVPNGAYKICDIRPAFGVIHQDYLTGYDYFGFSDLDIIYGDLRAFYTEEILQHNVLSTHDDRVSGHLCLIKNNEQWVNAFRKIPHWQALMSDPENCSVDEAIFTKMLRGSMRLPQSLSQLWGLFDPYKRNHFFQEQFSTIFSEYPWIDGSYDYPTQWFWSRGKLTTDQGQEMMYLHFMNWKSSRYLRPHYGQQSAWESLAHLVDPDFTDFSEGFCISPGGFTALKKTVSVG